MLLDRSTSVLSVQSVVVSFPEIGVHSWLDLAFPHRVFEMRDSAIHCPKESRHASDAWRQIVNVLRFDLSPAPKI
jgi:hypothetical protein